MRRSYVKKATALALALVLALLLPGCGGETSVWQETPVAPQKNDSLTVLCLGQQTKAVSMVQMALKLYQAMYPEVEVELIQSGANDTLEMDDERYRQIAAQIMAGEGPDVFIVDDAIMDVEKLVRQGVFADMEPFFEADNFDWEPYNQAVMDGGVWNGKRFIIPLNYSFPVLFTTRSVLEETGIDLDACGDIQGFLEENTRYLESEGRTRQLICGAKPFRSLLDESGLAIADYDARTIDLSSPVLKSLLRWNKTIIETDSDWDLSVAGGLTAAAAVREGAKVWAGSAVGPLFGLYEDYAALRTLGDEVVMLPIRDMDGGIRAEIREPVGVRANSENLQNAYNFIKLLLGRTVQSESQYGFNVTFTVLDAANEDYFIRMSDKHLTAADTDGFVSPTTSYYAVERPTREEFDQIMGYTREITGTYYSSHLGLYEAMEPYFMEGADYDETLAEAQRQLERYITE